MTKRERGWLLLGMWLGYGAVLFGGLLGWAFS